jgi:hypothetical protein
VSYDLMVFDPDLAPAAGEVGEWYGEVMETNAGSDDFAAAFDPASGQSDRLRVFYDAMRPRFPAMNGPDQTEDVDNERVTGYEFYPGFVYMDFRWSASEAAAEAVSALARRHGLGLYDPQGDEIILPGDRPKASGPWWRRLFGG